MRSRGVTARPSARGPPAPTAQRKGIRVDMLTMVWAAYLEVLAESGQRLSRDERRMLAEHRQRLLEASVAIQAADEATTRYWEQLELFSD